MSVRQAFRDLTTNADIEAALERARTYVETRPMVVSAEYRAELDALLLVLDSGIEVKVPRKLLQGLESAQPRDLESVTISVTGLGLHWESLNADHSVPSILNGIFGNTRWMSELGKKGGASRSEAKAVAARENGKKGGRPKLERKSA